MRHVTTPKLLHTPVNVALRASLHARSTVNTKHLAVDPLAILGSQEADSAGDINRKTDPVERGPTSRELGRSASAGKGEHERPYLVNTFVVKLVAVGNVLSADGMVHVGLDAAGGDGVDRDLLVAKV